MAIRIPALALVLLLVLTSTTTHGLQIKSEDALENLLSAYEAAWANSDSVALGELYTVDADYTGFDGVMTRGRERIVHRYESLIGASPGTRLTLEMSSLRFLNPDIALVDGVLTLQGIATTDAGHLQDGSAPFLAVAIKEDSVWRLTAFWAKSLKDPSTTHPR